MMEHLDVFAQAASWAAQGHRVALAIVTETWGSAPLPEGSALIVRDDGLFMGAVSAGCVEGAMIRAALEALSNPDARLSLHRFGVSSADDPWSAGLACGGELEIALEPRADGASFEAIVEALTHQRSATLHLRPDASPQLSLTPPPPGSPVVTRDDHQVQLNLSPPARLILIGAVHIAQRLTQLSAPLGLSTIIIDPRQSFAAPARHLGARLEPRWPQEVLPTLNIGPQDALIALSHDPKIDDPALLHALTTPASYIGALGSKRTHAARLSRLQEQGAAPQALARIRGPVGLSIGARGAAEIAISILADLIQTKRLPPT